MMSQPKKCHYIAATVVAGSFLQTTLGGEFEWATYLGGGGGDRVGHFNAVKVGPDGAVFVTGRTNSSDFPTTPGAYDSSFNGTWDVFVSKLSADGSTLLWSTYFGGLLTDRPYALSIDSQGRVVVAGETWSTDLPTTHDAYDTTHNGGNTVAWLAVFDPSETGDAQLVYSTFLGGAGTWDWIREIVCVAPDVFLIAGGTSSLDFPTTGGAYNTTYNGATGTPSWPS